MELKKILNELFKSSAEILLKRNENLIEANAIDRDIYFVKKGSLKIITTINHEEQIIRFAYKDSVFTALDSFISNQKTIYSVVAIKQSVILKIKYDEFQKFLKNEKNSKLWNNILENLILQQAEREIDLLTTSARERYNRLLERSPNVFQEIPNKFIANYLRISPETLSRLIKKS